MALNWKREPWRKLYVREEGTFATLPLLARALAAELIKIADDYGVIRTGGRQPAEAIAFQLGADRADRHVLPRLLGALFADQYLVVDPNGDLRIRNFRPAQMRWDRVRGDHGLDAERPPSDHHPTTIRPPSDHEPPTIQPSADHEPTIESDLTPAHDTNHAAPLDTKRYETIRYEEELSAQAPTESGDPEVFRLAEGTNHGKPKRKAPSGDHAAFVAAFDALYAEAHGGAKPTWGGRQGANVKALLKAHGLAECRRRAENMFRAPPPWPEGPHDLGTLAQHFDRFAQPHRRNALAQNFAPRGDRGLTPQEILDLDMSESPFSRKEFQSKELPE